jgi:hypothetical protein
MFSTHAHTRTRMPAFPNITKREITFPKTELRHLVYFKLQVVSFCWAYDVRTLDTELLFVLHRSTHIAVCVLQQIRLPFALTILRSPMPCAVVHTLSLQSCLLPVDHIGHACQVRSCHEMLHSVLKLFAIFCSSSSSVRLSPAAQSRYYTLSLRLSGNGSSSHPSGAGQD